MNRAYGLQDPNGLSEYSDFTRWKIIGGDATNWAPYSAPSGYPDQLALNGLYYLTQQQESRAWNMWQEILKLSQANYNTTTNSYDYPGLGETYHLGLWSILGSFLYPSYIRNQDMFKTNTLLQHYVSQRRLLLNTQVIDLSQEIYCGWTSSLYNPSGTSLINTESVSVSVLALGAGDSYQAIYEADQSMLSSQDSGYFYDNVNHYIGARLSQTQVHSKMISSSISLGSFSATTMQTLELLIRGYMNPSVDLSATVYTVTVTSSTGESSVYPVSIQDLLNQLPQGESTSASSILWQRQQIPLRTAAAADENVTVKVEVQWEGVIDLDIATVAVSST